MYDSLKIQEEFGKQRSMKSIRPNGSMYHMLEDMDRQSKKEDEDLQLTEEERERRRDQRWSAYRQKMEEEKSKNALSPMESDHFDRQKKAHDFLGKARNENSPEAAKLKGLKQFIEKDPELNNNAFWKEMITIKNDFEAQSKNMSPNEKRQLFRAMVAPKMEQMLDRLERDPEFRKSMQQAVDRIADNAPPELGLMTSKKIEEAAQKEIDRKLKQQQGEATAQGIQPKDDMARALERGGFQPGQRFAYQEAGLPMASPTVRDSKTVAAQLNATREPEGRT